MTKKESCCSSGAAAETSCCSSTPAAETSCCSGEAGAVREKFMAFVREATGAPGKIDARTKEAVTLALAIATRCGPCLKIHLKKASAMGFSPEEIEELVAIAVAFGGAPAQMFYNEEAR